MSREIKYTAIILKKQLLGEADEIVTFFTEESGKIRALAKSVRLPKAKLKGFLQPLYLVELAVTHNGQLPKIIRAETKLVFVALRQDLKLLNHALYACELALKFTPDGQKNRKLFLLLLDFFNFLETSSNNLEVALAKFKADFLTIAGFAATAHEDLAVQPVQLETCKALETTFFKDLGNQDWHNLEPLQKFLSRFIEHHFERTVNSERFINASVL